MRRALRWVAGVAGVILVLLLVLPYLLPFSSSGTLTERQAAAASLGTAPTYVEAAGLDVHVERVPAAEAVADAGEVPLLVVVHGFGASAATWRAMLPRLAELGEVVAYDRPAFGFTERAAPDGPIDPYGTVGQVAVLAELIETFRGEGSDRPVVLLGHSAGGALAAELALERADLVDGLVLVAPAILTTGGTPGWLRPVLSFPPIDRWGPRLARVAASGADRLLERSWHDPSQLTEEVRRRYREAREVIGWEQGLWWLVRSSASFGVAERPEALELPVLLVTGDDDRVVPTEDSQQLADLVDGAQLVVLEDTGHVPHEESPDAFVAAVTERWPLAERG